MTLPAHFGDPLGEQRRLVAGDTDRVGHWAFEAIRIAEQRPGLHDVPGPGQILRFLHLDGSDNVLPQTGDAVFAADQPVGQVTSAANHYELGPIALAAITAEARGPFVIVHQENDAPYLIAANG